MLLTSQEGKSVKFGCSSTENCRLPTKVAVSKVIGIWGWKLRVLDGHTCVLSVFLAYGPNWGLVSGMEVGV